MEIKGSSTQNVISEPNFRLNVKRNYKGDYGFEYTVKGDTIQQIQQHDFEIQTYLYNQGMISKTPTHPTKQQMI